MATEEVAKLRRHLDLLREEYVKLQTRLAESEKKCSVALAMTGDVKEDSFVSRLLNTVANLFDKELYSDLTVQLDRRCLRAHKFVLSARSANWGVPNLADVDQLDFSDISLEMGLSLMKWVYTDQIDLSKPDSFLLDLSRIAQRFSLGSLMDRCEKSLMSSVNVRNCVTFYQTADEIGAESLKKHCSELISNHWDDFTGDDFAHMSAPLLFKMFKTKTEYPLHIAVRTKREDVVFLFLIEYDSQLPGKLNELDSNGDLPLDLALRSRQESIARTLISHRAGVNVPDKRGHTLLHIAIERGDEFSALFLIENNASVDVEIPSENVTALHLTCSFNPKDHSPEVIAGMTRVAEKLLEHKANSNLQDANGNTPLHRCILVRNESIFHLLLKQPKIDLDIRNGDNHTVLWIALHTSSAMDHHPLAEKLVQCGASVDSVNPITGDTILHLAASTKNESAGLFLTERGAKLNITNSKGETPLHVACSKGLDKMSRAMMLRGANPNLQTAAPNTIAVLNMVGEEELAYLQTPLHLAILGKHQHCIQALLEHKAYAQRTNDAPTIVVPNFNLKNSRDQTPLSLALEMGLHAVAQQLLSGGASINVTNSEGMTMLHQAILNQDTQGSLFLLENGADITVRTRENETPLQLSVKRHLPSVVEALCLNGADLNVRDDSDCTPLWVALESGQEDIASILVKHGCDTNCWSEGPGGCYQTLLHRAIDENSESVACFLIRSECDVDACRRPGPDGRGDEEAHDQQSPLHLCCFWGLENIVQTLIEHDANVNAQDAEGKSPLHLAIVNQNSVIIALLLSHPNLELTLRDKQGLTPFAAAMTARHNKAAEAILARKPNAAEQFDNKGHNFLHIAIKKNDIESVLFLLSIHVNIQSRLQDSSQLTPLHLAVETGSEIIVRNLLLAGASVNDLTPQKQTSLHLAAIKDHNVISQVLLENGANCDAVDTNLNNALHLACQKGNLATCKVLLTESQINAEAVNLRGQSPLHMLAQYGKENAAAIFDFFMECMPNYPIDKPDAEGNTPLLLAYMNGNGNLCRSIVRAGSCIGAWNRQGVNIFNFQVATRQLLFRLLDFLSKEPPWCDGDVCMECNSKFGITTRKHHCRHCGRVLCSKCSERDMPVLKFNLNKPVRVCEMCFDVLTLGSSS